MPIVSAVGRVLDQIRGGPQQVRPQGLVAPGGHEHGNRLIEGHAGGPRPGHDAGDPGPLHDRREPGVTDVEVGRGEPEVGILVHGVGRRRGRPGHRDLGADTDRGEPDRQGDNDATKGHGVRWLRLAS